MDEQMFIWLALWDRDTFCNKHFASDAYKSDGFWRRLFWRQTHNEKVRLNS